MLTSLSYVSIKSNIKATFGLSCRLQSSEGTTPLFKGPEGTKISTTELRKIKVDIHRNIPGKSTPSELHRDIVNPEDVVLKRRAGNVLFFNIIFQQVLVIQYISAIEGNKLNVEDDYFWDSLQIMMSSFMFQNSICFLI